MEKPWGKSVGDPYARICALRATVTACLTIDTFCLLELAVLHMSSCQVMDIGQAVDHAYPSSPPPKIHLRRNIPEEFLSGPLRQVCVVNYAKEFPEICFCGVT